MNCKQKRYEDLEARKLMLVGLLGEYDEKLDYADDPAQIQVLKKKIERIKKSLQEISNEQKKLGNPHNFLDSKIPKENVPESSLEEIEAQEDDDSVLETLDEEIYETLSEEVKAVVEELRKRLERAKGKTFTFLLIGRAGVGKSSTINSLIGANVAPVGDFDPCTADVTVHETNLHGAIVRVIDTPGLCDDLEEVGNDAKYIELIRKKIPGAIDAVLFVSGLDDSRVDASEKRGLRLITEAFGEPFWKKSVIVFTQSDKVPDERFEEYVCERTKRIHAALLKLRLDNDTVHSIPSVAVDNTDPEKVNPDGQKWIQQLYLTVLDRAESDSKDVLILSTSHMLEKIGVTPLGIGEKLLVAGQTVNSGVMGSFLAYLLGVGSTSVGTAAGASGTVVTGTLLISNPIGWAVVLGSAAIGGGLTYMHMRKNKKGKRKGK
ncbi:MAG: GTPase [Cyanobacteria bacterium P01_A01_bin.80]